MPRFPITQSQIKDKKAVISGSDYKHAVKVLRLRVGDELTLFKESGIEYFGIITKIGTKDIEVEVKEVKETQRESRLNITLLQGIPKGNKLDFIVEKATELGVRTLAPVITERSQLIDTRRLERWRKIAREASKQCGRTKPMEVLPITNFSGAIESEIDKDLKIIFWEGATRKLKELTKNHSLKTVTLLVGPEGGFSKKEVEEACDMGFIPIGLGPRILRTETASVVGVTLIQFLFGDI